MKRKNHGTLVKSSLVAGEQYKTYMPEPLPPVPAIEMPEIAAWLDKASFAIGELNGITENVPPSIINYLYVRKEAVISSQIEGTQSTLDDLLRYESNIVTGRTKISMPLDDVAEVSSYVAALNHGLKRMNDGFPLSIRLIRE
ncbi:MAG: hypothetical protein LBI06_00730, partial [Treponema sp.]|nr:hypothetical protein [Treponema sp.]